MICTSTRACALVLSFVINLPLLSTRHDVPEKRYEELGEDFPAVGSVVGWGTGTLVDNQWVLTAAHVPEFFDAIAPDKEKRFFVVNGKSYKIVDVYFPPHRKKPKLSGGEALSTNAHDLALLKLGETVLGIDPAAIYGGDDEVGQEFVLVGCGSFWGNGSKGATIREGMAIPRGKRRAGTNRFERVALEGKLLHATFDTPDSGAATDLEAGVFGGDSGGPMLLKVGKQWRIAGVASMSETGDDDLVGNYGDVIIATRVSRYADWIRNTIAKN